jgi:hypothetical protein
MTQILDALDEEWSATARSPGSRRALMRWSNAHPEFLGLEDLDGVLARRREPGRAGAILAALARMAPSDTLAARTLLQIMLPGLICLAGRTAADDPVAIDEMISLAWERIRTYPTHRTSSVAGNILLDVRKQYRRHRRFEAPRDLVELTVEPVDDTATPEDAALARLTLDQLRAAQRDGVVSADALATIIRTRVVGERISDLAAEQNVSCERLWHRRWRAEARLRELPLAG